MILLLNKLQVKIKNFMHTRNQINQALRVLIDKKTITTIKMKKLRNMCGLRYLIPQYETLILLYLSHLFIEIIFLFNQMVIEINIY